MVLVAVGTKALIECKAGIEGETEAEPEGGRRLLFDEGIISPIHHSA